MIATLVEIVVGFKQRGFLNKVAELLKEERYLFDYI